MLREVHLRLPFDYEARRTHRFVLVAADADDRRAFATLTVNVLDENDNTPQFVAPTVEASVSAGSHPGESVLMVSVWLGQWLVDQEELPGTVGVRVSTRPNSKMSYPSFHSYLAHMFCLFSSFLGLEEFIKNSHAVVAVLLST